MMQCHLDIGCNSKGESLQLTCGADVGSASAGLLMTPCSTDALFCIAVKVVPSAEARPLAISNS